MAELMRLWRRIALSLPWVTTSQSHWNISWPISVILNITMGIFRWFDIACVTPPNSFQSLSFHTQSINIRDKWMLHGVFFFCFSFRIRCMRRCVWRRWHLPNTTSTLYIVHHTHRLNKFTCTHTNRFDTQKKKKKWTEEIGKKKSLIW